MRMRILFFLLFGVVHTIAGVVDVTNDTLLVKEPTEDNHAASKHYVDTQVAGSGGVTNGQHNVGFGTNLCTEGDANISTQVVNYRVLTNNLKYIKVYTNQFDKWSNTVESVIDNSNNWNLAYNWVSLNSNGVTYMFGYTNQYDKWSNTVEWVMDNSNNLKNASYATNHPREYIYSGPVTNLKYEIYWFGYEPTAVTLDWAWAQTDNGTVKIYVLEKNTNTAYRSYSTNLIVSATTSSVKSNSFTDGLIEASNELGLKFDTLSGVTNVTVKVYGRSNR